MGEATDIFRVGAHGGSGAGRYALAPVLLGLMAPAIVILIIDAEALANPGLVFQVYFTILFVLASCAYFISVFEAGEITGVTVDRTNRQIIIEKTGMLTRAETAIPFADVAAIRIESHYDDDGYQTSVPVLVLTTREVVTLPAGTTETDIVGMRAMMSRR